MAAIENVREFYGFSSEVLGRLRGFRMLSVEDVVRAKLEVLELDRFDGMYEALYGLPPDCDRQILTSPDELRAYWWGSRGEEFTTSAALVFHPERKVKVIREAQDVLARGAGRKRVWLDAKRYEGIPAKEHCLGKGCGNFLEIPPETEEAIWRELVGEEVFSSYAAACSERPFGAAAGSAVARSACLPYSWPKTPEVWPIAVGVTDVASRGGLGLVDFADPGRIVAVAT